MFAQRGCCHDIHQINVKVYLQIYQERDGVQAHIQRERDTLIVRMLIHREMVGVGIDTGVVHNDMDGF